MAVAVSEEGARLVEYVTQTVEPPVAGDEVEEIAMFGRSRVGPFAGGALAAIRPFQANEQAAARCVRDVADQPIATLASTVREIMSAHRLGIAREPVRQFGGL